MFDVKLMLEILTLIALYALIGAVVPEKWIRQQSPLTAKRVPGRIAKAAATMTMLGFMIILAVALPLDLEPMPKHLALPAVGAGLISFVAGLVLGVPLLVKELKVRVARKC